MLDGISDEMLMAYADGELGGLERDEIAKALARDMELRRRLRVFERTGAVLAQAFDAPLPTGFTARRGVRLASPSPSWLDGLFSAVAPIHRHPMGAAAAMALLLAVAVIAFRPTLFAPQEGEAIASIDGRAMAGGALRTALEIEKSSGGLKPGATTPAIVQTFRSNEGRYCREYMLAPGSRGVACREPDGGWPIKLHIAGSTGQDGTSYAPASAANDQVIDSYVHQVMEGDPLPADAEASAIDTRWRGHGR